MQCLVSSIVRSAISLRESKFDALFKRMFHSHKNSWVEKRKWRLIRFLLFYEKNGFVGWNVSFLLFGGKTHEDKNGYKMVCIIELEAIIFSNWEQLRPLETKINKHDRMRILWRQNWIIKCVTKMKILKAEWF